MGSNPVKLNHCLNIPDVQGFLTKFERRKSYLMDLWKFDFKNLSREFITFEM
jgi:hypothetical protein